ncbi:NTPase KAP family P-loop domain-containing protein 1 [Scomber scombrus]|uniref:NTPase KAP family P-loop domain-containing protein 1 n=1 Tax=Scomber scombrus TaxID=13677 RepID=UPI002DDBCF47|nr:NTPase KAP family P-loop domain-containing protein 1 [Scomber scombrus]
MFVCFLNLLSDNSYAYALSKTLTKVSSPATVGLYSSCQDRLNMILKQMEVYMEKEALEIEQNYKRTPRPRSVTPSFTGFLALIGRLLFYNPIWTQENLNHHNIRFIYVHFSAWHFAGSDVLWAGLVLRLFQAMRMNFGILQMVLYRVAQYEEEDEIKKKIVEDGPKNWRSKKICCCPLWLLLLCILVVPVIILIFWLTHGFPKPEVAQNGTVNGTTNEVGVLEGLVIAALGVPAASALRYIFLIGKNLIFSQDLNIRRGMDNERVSKQLGFMNEVRKEMWFLCRFIQFMEVFERRRIRVVLKITNLGHCSPKKIVGVLDAVNILLSDEESPFISILAVNPEVIVEKVNFADGCYSKEDRAYAFLNRIITLAFTVPPLCNVSKRILFCNLTSNSKILEDKNNMCHKSSSSSDLSSVEKGSKTNESHPLLDKTLQVKEEEVEILVKNILNRNERRLNKYMLDDVMSMRRVINSIRVTVIIMKALKIEGPAQSDKVAPWVVLANQWPCRLSWIIQCVEDAQQRADIERAAITDDSKTLWQVFSESRAELYVMSAQIEELLEHDGDPEMFEKFLKVDFQFIIKDLKILEVATVNLDPTIRKELAQLRGTSRLKDSGWMRNLAPLPIATIINMDTEDVCNELERMKYPRKYIDIVKSNNLNGSALVFGDAEELKDLLGMNFGEWATFRLHFLGLPSHLRQQHKNMLSTPSHSQSQLPILHPSTLIGPQSG